jgi:hypothetical protein
LDVGSRQLTQIGMYGQTSKPAKSRHLPQGKKREVWWPAAGADSMLAFLLLFIRPL